MRGTVLLILLFAVALLVPTAYAGQSYTITLTNGNILTANSYRVEDGKVYLKYPVGEVALPASEVASISAGDRGVELLQIKGALQPKTSPQSPPGHTAGGPSTSPVPAAGSASPAAGARPAIDAMRESFREQKRLFLERRQQAMTAAGESAGRTGTSGGFLSQGRGDPQLDALIEQLDTADDAHRAELEQKLEKRLDEIINDMDGGEK